MSKRCLYLWAAALTVYLWTFDGGYPQAVYLAKSLALGAFSWIGWSSWQQGLWGNRSARPTSQPVPQPIGGN